ASLVLDFCSRLRRELSGWAPEDELTLSEWVKERVAIPNDEWEILQKYIPEELKEALGKDKSLNGKLEYVKRKGANTAAVVHTDRVEKWKEAESEEIISSFLPLWLRYEGPLPLFRIEDVFGFSQAETEKAVQNLLALDELAEEITVKEESSSFPAGQKPENVYTGSNLICDRENLELLLRLSRRKQRPVIKERPPAVLVPLLARRQSLFMKGGKNISEIDAILSHPWEKLAGFPAPAKLWETEFFPCRSPSYQGETLDSEIREGRLIWYGTGREKIAFSKITDIDLVLPPALSAPLFSGRLPSDFFDKLRDFWEIKGALGEARSEAAAEALWKEVWKSSLSADSFEPLRYALLHGFASKKPGERESSPFPAETARDSPFGGRSTRRLPRALRERWKTGTPVKGNWFSLAADSPVTDSLSILEEQELNRERVQLLLNRYGVLARPLLEREAPLLSWSKLMPAIRRMELSGELVAGRFFGGINSLQFASPGIAEELEEAESNREIYWMNAADPASPAGLDAEGVIKTGEMRSLNLPVRRVVSTRLCFRGSQLIAISSRGGRELEFFISPDDPGMEEVLSFIKFPKTRKIGAESRLIVEKINRESAARSIYSAILVNTGFIKDRGKIVLW
ncbi:MAG: hypothetical protein FWH35_09875, partial [Treponema sp.]|nr:hypothetical protein [Treponema sp.]